MKSYLYQKSRSGMGFDVFNVILMLALCFVTLYPIWYILINSFNEGMDAVRGGILWWPRKFSIDNYKIVFSDEDILSAFGISAARTVLGSVSSTFFTAMVAYGISKKDLIGRKYYLLIGTVTLFFNGGLIPNFLLIKNLGLYNNFLVYIIPHMFSFFTMIIFQAYFRQLPEEIEESAKIDGANEFLIFAKIIIPLSSAIIAAFLLFSGVYHWNDYFIGLIYTQSRKLVPIQTFLYRIITENSTGNNDRISAFQASVQGSVKKVTPEAIKLATMVTTTFPVICLYPFLQKYFVKGMLVGSVKG